jgi:hypothetical protein
VECLEGARAVQRVLEELSPSARVSASLVWVNVLGEDDAQAAQAATGQFHHARLLHFHDPHQLAARQMAATLGGAGYFAWDTYLVFASGATWEDAPPLPENWVHQLDHSSWAPAERRRKGEGLVQALYHMLINHTND